MIRSETVIRFRFFRDLFFQDRKNCIILVETIFFRLRLSRSGKPM